jgi:predicted RNA-binding Zn-ribbon protein involved in translation (DUF1610 family)
MSRGGRIFVGIAAALNSVGFLTIPLLGPMKHPEAFFAIGVVCALVALACFWARSRPVTIRLIAFAFLAPSAWIVINNLTAQIYGAPPVAQMSAGMLYVLIITIITSSWFAVFGPGRKHAARRLTSVLLRSNVIGKRLPPDALLTFEGFAMPVATFMTITRERGEESRKRTPKWRQWVGVWCAGLPLLAGLPLRFAGVPTWIAFIAMFGAMIAWAILWTQPSRRVRVEIQRASLNAHGFPVCMQCGHNLTGVPTESACPECGAERTLARCDVELCELEASPS